GTVYAAVSKTVALTGLGVRIPPTAPSFREQSGPDSPAALAVSHCSPGLSRSAAPWSALRPHEQRERSDCSSTVPPPPRRCRTLGACQDADSGGVSRRTAL